MDKKPKFSVIIPVYNREGLIERCINSVLNQEYKDLQLVCVDDGSTDKTGELLNKYTVDRRVKVVSQDHKGRCAARNTGFTEADGEWICFLDSDDFYYENHLSTFINLIDECVSFQAFATTLVHDHPLTAKNKVNKEDKKVLALSDFISDNPISLIQLCIHNSLCHQLKFYEDDLPIAEDLLFIRELAHRTSIWKCGKPTVEVGEHDNRSMNATRLVDIAKYNVKSASLFCQRNRVRDNVKHAMMAWSYLLAGHICIQAGACRKARGHLRSAVSIGVSYGYLSLYVLVAKSFFCGVWRLGKRS